MADISSRKLKTLLIATAIVAVTSFSIGLLRLNAFSLKGPKGGKDSERKKSLPSEQSGPNSSEVNNDSIDEKSLEKDAEVSHDPVVKSLAGPSSSQVAESKSYAEAAHAQNNISSDEVISTTFLETGMMPQPQIHNPSKVPKIAINLDHPFDSEYSNTFYEDSDGEICLVDSLLIPQPVPFDTILLQAFPHQHTFQDHSSLNKNEEKRLRFSEGILGPVQTPKKDNIKKQTEHELFASSNDKNKDFNPTKIPLSSNNNITLLNNMDTLLNESKHAPSLPPTLLEEDLENLEKVDQLETESCPTIQKNMQSSNLEISDEKEGDVKCTSPAAKPLKPTSFNVLANEFIPSSYNIPQQQYHFDNDYESSMYQQVYQQQGENWNPYMSQENGGYYSPNVYGTPQVSEGSNKKSSTLNNKNHKKQGKRNSRPKLHSVKHEKVSLGDFIDFDLGSRSSTSLSGGTTVKRQRQKSSSICIYGLTCANKECFYIHQ